MTQTNGREWEQLREEVQPVQDVVSTSNRFVTGALVILLVIMIMFGIAIGRMLQ